MSLLIYDMVTNEEVTEYLGELANLDDPKINSQPMTKLISEKFGISQQEACKFLDPRSLIGKGYFNPSK